VQNPRGKSERLKHFRKLAQLLEKAGKDRQPPSRVEQDFS
jgi:hypothetical protein